MEQEKQPISGFKIVNLLLLESDFKRVSSVTFEQDKISSTINVDVNVQVVKNSIFVTETIKYEQKSSDISEVNATIKMVGVFEKIGDSELNNLEEFGRINGAAIIFPYIREHLTNLSAKAGINVIILPPFNFTKTQLVQEVNIASK